MFDFKGMTEALVATEKAVTTMEHIAETLDALLTEARVSNDLLGLVYADNGDVRDAATVIKMVRQAAIRVGQE